MRQSACTRPLSDRHAQPDWIGGGSESRQMMQALASPLCGAIAAEAIEAAKFPDPLKYAGVEWA